MRGEINWQCELKINITINKLSLAIHERDYNSVSVYLQRFQKIQLKLLA